MFVVIDVYGANTECGKCTIICRLNSFNILVIIATFALSVLNKNPSGKITATRPLNFSIAIIAFINESSIFELISSIGKLLFMLSLVCTYRSSSLRADVKNPPVLQAKIRNSFFGFRLNHLSHKVGHGAWCIKFSNVSSDL